MAEENEQPVETPVEEVPTQEPEQPELPEVPSEPEVPVTEEPVKEELDGVAILEKMAESVAKLKEQEKEQVEKISLLEAEVKSLKDAAQAPAKDGSFSQEQVNNLMAKSNKEHADAVAALKVEQQNALDAKQTEMSQKIAALKTQAKAIIANMDSADDRLAQQAAGEIDAL